MSGQSFTEEQKEEIKHLVHEALAEFFKGYGLLGGNLLYTAAKIIGALVVIFGGFKLFLTWIGFSYISK